MKNKKEIDDKFEQILLGAYPKNSMILNLAYPTYNMLKLQEYDEDTILKAIIITYHEHVCKQFTKQVNETRFSKKPILKPTKN